MSHERNITDSSLSRRWLVRSRPNPGARVRLLCFPYAGAGASAYRQWGAEIAPDIEVAAVQLPGRESRFNESAPTDLRAVAEQAADAILPEIRPPFAVFGHSMGAWLAFEFTRICEGRGTPPVHLFVSGRRAPHTHERFPLMGELGDDELVAELDRRGGGMAPEILANRELLKLLIRTIRADVRAVERYQPIAVAPALTVRVTALGGTDDRFVDLDELSAWRSTATAPVAVESFPGGHFFIHGERSRVLQRIATTLLPEVEPPR
jgi:medium-chain acyl-[acyl-carrier-protein] hydrolase